MDIGIKEGLKTQSYKETINIDIENIFTHLKRDTKYIQLNGGQSTNL